MGFLQSLTRPAAPARRSTLENPSVSIHDPEAWAAEFGTGLESAAGEPVNAQSTISLSAYWAMVKLISGDVSKWPLQMARKQPDGRKPMPDASHYLADMLSPEGQANPELSYVKMMRRAMVHATVYENAYIWMDWRGGRIQGFYPLLSDRSTVVRGPGRQLFVVTEMGVEDNKPGELIARPYDEVLHIEGLCLDGKVGCETIQAARDDIGVALASRGFKSSFFSQGMHAGGILQVPPGASPQAQAKVEQAIQQQHSSTKRAFATLALHDGFKWHTTQIDASRAQLTEIDDAELRNAARRMLCNPSRLGVRDSVSYNSLAEDRRDYYDTAIGYWTSLLVAELNTKALTKRERREWLFQYAANVGLLFADAATLANVAAQLTNAKDQAGRPIVEADEARAWLHLPPRDNNGAPPPLPQPTPEEPPADEEDEGEEGGDDRTARAWLVSEARRLVRRFVTGGRRAEAGGRWQQWLAELAERQLEPAAASLAEPLSAFRERPADSATAAGRLLDWAAVRLGRNGPQALEQLEQQAADEAARIFNLEEPQQ